jgi:hypothetical protein
MPPNMLLLLLGSLDVLLAGWQTLQIMHHFSSWKKSRTKLLLLRDVWGGDSIIFPSVAGCFFEELLWMLWICWSATFHWGEEWTDRDGEKHTRLALCHSLFFLVVFIWGFRFGIMLQYIYRCWDEKSAWIFWLAGGEKFLKWFGFLIVQQVRK